MHVLAVLLLALLAAPWASAASDPQDRLLSVRQAADLLGLSPETLQGWRYRSYLRPAGFPLGFKVGGRVRWSQRDLQAWIDQQRGTQGNGHPQP
jgi:predicted DNA-binding transcriptional regulator AlpA